MNIVDAKFGKQAPQGLAADLRAMADAVDRGDITKAVVSYTENGEFKFLWAASLYDSLVLSDMLHARAMLRMNEEVS